MAQSHRRLSNAPSICGVGDTAYRRVRRSTAMADHPKNELYVGNIENTFKDFAGFGELTAHITQAWSVTGGLRVFRQTLTQSQQNALMLVAAPEYDTPPTSLTSSGSWSRALGKVNTSYQLDANNLVYATWSQGFRHGGINALPSSAGGVTTPASVAQASPDTANNYEIGAKGTLDNRFRYSAAIYDIQWKNIQEEVSLTPIVLPGVLNIGNGYSRGAELELDNALDFAPDDQHQLHLRHDQAHEHHAAVRISDRRRHNAARGQSFAGHAEEQPRGHD